MNRISERFDTMKLTKLLTYLMAEPVQNDFHDPDITSIEMDSREVRKGVFCVYKRVYGRRT